MGLVVSDSGGGQFERIPEGTHLAICYAVCDLGIVESEAYGPKHKVLICWETPNELNSKGEPYEVAKQFTASLNEKSTLRRDLESWRGRKFTDEELKGFDLKNILSKPCQVTVVHNTTPAGKTYANVNAVTSIPKGVSLPSQFNPTIWYDRDESEDSVVASMPDWMRKRVRPDLAELVEASVATEDDIPF